MEDLAKNGSLSIEDVFETDVCTLTEDTPTGGKKIAEGFIYPSMTKIGTEKVPPNEYAMKLTKVEYFSAIYDIDCSDRDISPTAS